MKYDFKNIAILSGKVLLLITIILIFSYINILHDKAEIKEMEKTDEKAKNVIQEGLDKIFIEAGFDWREPGCSMCLAMNPDQLKPQERCASTSNRNFEGRQGRGGRTHLVSPGMAIAAAIKGYLTDVRKI